MHWGNEYERHENAEQRRLACMLRRKGADIVVGSHPHVIQPFEADSTGAVFYSLGNLVSNQQRRYCDGGLIASIDVVRCDTLPQLQYIATATPRMGAVPRLPHPAARGRRHARHAGCVTSAVPAVYRRYEIADLQKLRIARRKRSFKTNSCRPAVRRMPADVRRPDISAEPPLPL